MAETQNPNLAYCVKCKEKREIASPQAVFLGHGTRPALQGVCPVCGARLVRFGRTPAHERLEAEEGTTPPHPPRPIPSREGTGPKMVIVESPAKARTLARFLGRDYAVESSVGHVRDLPINRMGVDIEHDFQPHYVIPAGKKEVVKKLQTRARQASELYLATDPDREGEAIAWHLRTVLERQLRDIPVHRVEFHEITQEAVRRAFAHPREIDQRRVDSQQARRILDRVVGYTLSPLLRDKVGRKGLSAGRVQSVALRLVCEREREIEAFVPVEYWSIEAELSKQETAGAPPPASFIARLVKIRGQDPDLKNRDDAQAIVNELKGALYIVDKVSRGERSRAPAPPFITSTLQQEASRKLGFTAKRTMAVAQALYEGKEIGGGERVGLITYMRTDSVNVSASAQAEARRLIAERFGPEYLPPHPPHYKTRVKSAQEAHEAIRPTSVGRDPASLKPYLSSDELRLYTLIWKRFMASQMAAAIFDQTVVDILAGPGEGERPYLFRATGSVLKFPGFLKVYQEGRDEGEQTEEGEGVQLPPLQPDERLTLIRLLPKQHFTQPPPRYTDATLIRALEEYGIGRPSTYAPILSILQERRYVERMDRKLVPTALGFCINDLLVEYFPEIVNVGFTAQMEEKLDGIATGEEVWVPMLHEFYDSFASTVEAAREKMPRVALEPEPTGEQCPECGQPLLFRSGRFGRFIGCSGWPQCRYTAPVPIPGVACPVCGGAVIEMRTRRGRRFYRCIHYRSENEPSCPWTSSSLPKKSKEARKPEGSSPLSEFQDAP